VGTLRERWRELAAVEVLLERRGGVLVVEGRAGIGKTSLIEVACWRAEELGYEVLRARGSELEAGFGFGVVVQLFPMAMTMREAFEKGTRTFNAHDIDGFTSVLADDVSYHAPGGISGQGNAACAGIFAGWFGTFTGTHNGPLPTPAGDIPPTGCPVTVGYIQVPHFRDGKHASFSLMYDRLAMLEQLGLFPAPASTG
jgi:SnoaL-like domain